MKALIATVIFLVSLQAPTYDLIWKPKAGMKVAYTLRAEGKLLEEDLLVTSDVDLHVKQVEANGDYTMGTTFKNGTFKFGAESEKMPDGPEEVEKFNRRGEELDKDKKKQAGEDDPDMFSEILGRAAEIQPPTKPVAVGETWTHEFPEDKAMKLPKAIGTYKILEVKDSKVVVSLQYAEQSVEDPTTATGKLILSDVDFLPLSLESDVKNVRFHDGVPPGNVRLTMKVK